MGGLQRADTGHPRPGELPVSTAGQRLVASAVLPAPGLISTLSTPPINRPLTGRSYDPSSTGALDAAVAWRREIEASMQMVNQASVISLDLAKPGPYAFVK